MMTDICQYLHNWFNRKPDGSTYPQYSGTFTVADDSIVELSGKLVTGQYFRIIGSLFNDGVHKLGSDTLKNEVFDGAVWSMAVPPVVVSLAAEIADWQAKYGSVSSEAMSPFQSESFAGYSYSKANGGVSSNGSVKSQNTWQNVYEARLAPWRKLP